MQRSSHLAAKHHPEASLGLVYGIAAYASWGIVPIYFKSVAHVAPLAVLAHRIVWSVALLLIVLAISRRWREVIDCVRHRRTLMLLLASTIAIAVNWYVFIWSVANNQLLAASLGYFMNPLVSVLLGMIVLGERLRVMQILAVLLAAGAVIAIVVAEGTVPIVAISLALSFGTYGLLRKQAVVAPTVGLFVETAMLLPFAMFIAGKHAATSHTTPNTYALLSLSGVVTAVPMIWFVAGARRLRLSTMGFLQYLSPTGQFLLGRFVYDEPLNRAKLACFAVVWLALLIFTIDSARAYRASRSATM